jgi:hypothetical protein
LFRSGAGGGTRTLTGLPPTDFRTIYGFRRLACRVRGLRRVCGLDYPFTVAFAQVGVRLRCCPSSLYTFPLHVHAWGLGSGLPRERFPRIWAVLLLRFPGGHSNVQVRCVYRSATPAADANLTTRPPCRQWKTHTRDSSLSMRIFFGVSLLGRADGFGRRILMMDASTMFLMWEA